MKLKISTILMVAVITSFSFLAFTPKAADTYTVDLTKSSISWEAKKLVGGHTGTIDLTSGNLVFNGKKLTGGGFTGNMSSIKTSDNGKPNAGLDRHLKADDFFGVEKFPESKFVIKKVAGNGANVTVTGDLTVKGITNSISFPATLTWNADKTVSATADKIEIDRTKFGIQYRSKSIFSDIGDKMIEDNFTIAVKLVVKK